MCYYYIREAIHVCVILVTLIDQFLRTRYTEIRTQFLPDILTLFPMAKVSQSASYHYICIILQYFWINVCINTEFSTIADVTSDNCSTMLRIEECMNQQSAIFGDHNNPSWSGLFLFQAWILPLVALIFLNIMTVRTLRSMGGGSESSRQVRASLVPGAVIFQ